ncbi:MAG TPA: sulfur carrier protein ThiS [Candidatus Methylomirabilis sp.]|jgi:thiamine biosynthesis protein ThiS|nr:sulfur carrier protein ThiS [Candidatus Methylomirabilis sp.]
MQLRVNGKTRVGREGLTVTGLLDDLQIHPQRVAVQLNGEILRREQFPEVVLKDGDTVEIITFMAGGTGEGGAAW